MKILLLCLNAFETMEVSPFVDVMGWARDDFDCDISVTTCGFHKEAVSTFGIKVELDITMDEVRMDAYDALVIPGGFQEYGFYDEAFDERTLSLIRSFHTAGRMVVSVCVAAFALAESGILKGRKATTYHLRDGFKQRELAKYEGITVVNEPIVVDGNIITSSCPQTAPYVAFALLEYLTDKKTAHAVQRNMGY